MRSGNPDHFHKLGKLGGIMRKGHKEIGWDDADGIHLPPDTD
jgi:hypothetical protein